MKIEGGCLCGKVRYSAEAEAVLVAVCHCRNCQRASGTAFSVAVAIPKQTLAVQGALKTFNDRADSGRTVYRRFCPECGSSVIDEAEARPDVVGIAVGTLDDPSWIKPTIEVFCDRAHPWVTLGGERRRFSRGMGGG